MAMRYQVRIVLPEGGGQIIREGLEGLIGESIDLGALAWVGDYRSALASLRGDFLAASGPAIGKLYRSLFDLALPAGKSRERNLESMRILSREGERLHHLGPGSRAASTGKASFEVSLRECFPCGGRHLPFKVSFAFISD